MRAWVQCNCSFSHKLIYIDISIMGWCPILCVRSTQRPIPQYVSDMYLQCIYYVSNMYLMDWCIIFCILTCIQCSKQTIHMQTAERLHRNWHLHPQNCKEKKRRSWKKSRKKDGKAYEIKKFLIFFNLEFNIRYSILILIFEFNIRYIKKRIRKSIDTNIKLHRWASRRLLHIFFFILFVSIKRKTFLIL